MAEPAGRSQARAAERTPGMVSTMSGMPHASIRVEIEAVIVGSFFQTRTPAAGWRVRRLRAGSVAGRCERASPIGVP
ncbi:MAG: hypothetical protein AMXMBFR77_21800 [Phycisphaerales bacterium]